jgi:uncharacterized membrane protein YdjX (TVP38/TMEM64 family)
MSEDRAWHLRPRIFQSADMRRLFWIFAALALLFLVPFLIWGESIAFAEGGAVAWLQRYGRWAWAAAMLLLICDLFLPVPATAVMAALGFVYGTFAGGLIGAAGSFLSGALAYSLSRGLGRRAALRIAGADDLAEGERLFQRFGGWLVALSRWLPLFPEVIACMAGLTRMPRLIFFIALACGSLPMGFTFAAIGAAGVGSPVLAIVISAVLPPLLWWAIHRLILR